MLFTFSISLVNVRDREKVNNIYSYGDLEDDTSLVRFFKEVLDRRDDIDEAEKQAKLAGANSNGWPIIQCEDNVFCKFNLCF